MDLRLGYDAMIVFVLAFVPCATNPVQAADIPGKPEGTLTTAMAPWCRNGIVFRSQRQNRRLENSRSLQFYIAYPTRPADVASARRHQVRR